MDMLHSAPIVFLAFLLIVSLGVVAQGAPPDVPDAEKPLLNTVDPWGLPFSDQLARFESHFAQSPQAPFAVGVTHDLVKVWPTKYWFRGDVTVSGAAPMRVGERWAAAGETQSFQVAVLPRMGAPEATYSVTVEAPNVEARVYREVFVRTSAEAAYPRFASERWPDPLLAENAATLSSVDCGVFWVDVRIPGDAPAGEIACTVTVGDGAATATAIVPIRVVPGLDLDAKAYPFIAWFRKRDLTDEQYRDLCALALEHHVVPVDALKGRWDPEDPGKFDDLRAFLAARGQRMFEVDRPGGKNFDSLYAHLKEKGWLDATVAYSNQDEPDDAQFVEKNIPWMRMVREKYPGLKVYLASDWHENMDQGCDAWMTDLSSSGYDPDGHADLRAPELWHYYCHLPIRFQLRAPLVMAPNMQIDNPALEQRLALWMSHHYGAKVVFIWSGCAYTFGDDFWETLTLSDKPSGYPYAGVHNGNGWVVYPAPEGGGTTPSLRLKLIRDGLEDVAILQAARRRIAEGRITGDRAEQLSDLLNPAPGVFVHPQYFDRLPETLLGRREAILRLLAE